MTSDHSSNGNGHADQSPVSSGTDTSAIRSLVSQTRRLLRSTWVATGLLASFGLGLLLVVAMTMTDFLVSSAMPSEWTALRAIALVLLVVPTTWAVIAGVLRPLFRRLSNVLVARRIEFELPKIHNRLVTCIDLEDEERAVPVSEAFHRRLVSEALERIKGFHPRRVLDIQNLRRASVVATVGVLALAVVFIPGVRTAMARVFNPFSDIPPAGHVAYTVKVGNSQQQQEGDGYVVRGDDVEFLIEFTDGRTLYEDEALQLTIETVNDENEAVVIRHASPISDKLESRDGLGFWKFGLKGLEHDFHYRVSGGGTYTRRYAVKMLERPEIVSVGTTLTYPDYMEKPERISSVADVEGPVGSSVVVGVVAEGDIHEGKIEFLELKRVRQSVADRSPRNWFASTRPKGSAPSGTWKVESLAGQDAHTDPPNTAAHSHGFTKATEPFQVGTNDVLFSTVYLPPDQLPRQIMLKWHDGTGWEHRAFWGEDLIGEGKPGTVSRFRVGDLPPQGQLVTLEVPAAAVGLAGRSVSGMMFSLHGGQAVWGNSGAMPPAQETVVKLLPTGQTFELKPTTPTGSEALKEGQSYFTGTFPLVKNGLYRVQLKNKADRNNRTMAEAKIVAIPDNPPQVIIERPRQTLILSRPQPVPVFITSFDDFGVKEVVLSVRTGDQETFVGEPVVTLSPPLQNDHRDITLDLADRGLKTGDTLTYRVEVRDGNGQTGQTIDYVIQIKDDNSAADKQFEQLEKQTDTFRDKLVELISKQQKIQVKSSKLEQDYKQLTEKIEKAQVEADEQQKKDEAKDKTKDKTKKDAKAEKPAEVKPIVLDPEEQKKLDELKKALAELAVEENANVKLAEQVKNDLGALAKQAEENPLVPPQVADQFKQLEGAFEKAAVDPLKQLAQDLQQAATPKQQDTKLPEIKKQADRVQKDLETIQKRMDALARAQRDSRDDLKQAMRDLKKDLLQQDADLTRDALQDLKDYLKAMQKDLEALQGKEENLLKDSLQDLTSKDLLDALREQQKEAAKKSNKKLDETAELLDAKRQKRLLDFPDRPYKPEDKKYKIPPKERDTDEGDPTKEDEDAKKKGDKNKDKKKGEEEESEEDFFLPAISGLKAELDPRFEKMIRDLKEKLKKQQEDGKKSSDPEQQERNRKQLQRLEELDMANRALKSDQKSLEDLKDQLQQAQQKSQDGQPQQQQAQQSLEQMLQQALMQKARKMMQRMQQQQKGQQANQPQDQQKNQQKNQQPMPPQSTLANQLIGNQKPDGLGTDQVLVDLGKFDVATQRVIMKMQPKEREELLQGLREEGPKAYRGFIRDYFKKLSRARVKVPKK